MSPQQSQKPVYLIFAGINGAGKSTFFQSGVWKRPDLRVAKSRVNSDEFLRDDGGDPLSISDQLKAGRKALRIQKQLLEEGVSFNQETTLTGHRIMHTIKEAHDKGYRVVMFYIGLASPDLALQRIENRVESGGHPINEADVRRRFQSTLKNLSLVIDYCEEATVLDNTLDFTVVAYWSKGVLSWVGDLKQKAPWLIDALLDEG